MRPAQKTPECQDFRDPYLVKLQTGRKLMPTIIPMMANSDSHGHSVAARPHSSGMSGRHSGGEGAEGAEGAAVRL